MQPHSIELDFPASSASCSPGAKLLLSARSAHREVAISCSSSLCKNQLIKTDQDITDVVIEERETSAWNYPARCFKTDKAFTASVLGWNGNKWVWGMAGGMWSLLYRWLGRGRGMEGTECKQGPALRRKGRTCLQTTSAPGTADKFWAVFEGLCVM